MLTNSSAFPKRLELCLSSRIPIRLLAVSLIIFLPSHPVTLGGLFIILHADGLLFILVFLVYLVFILGQPTVKVDSLTFSL